VAAPAFDGAQLCASTLAGDSWSCRTIGGTEGSHPDLTIDSTGVLHMAWADAHGGGYSTSLGSFVAINWPAGAQFEPPVPWPNTVIIDADVSDRDGDAVEGSIAVGQVTHRRTTVPRSEIFEFLGDSIVNSGGGLFAVNGTLLFRIPGGKWHTGVSLEDIASFPVEIDVRTIDRRFFNRFTIEAWHELAVSINQAIFTPHLRKTFAGSELPSFDLQPVPAGALTVRVSVSDGASWRAFDAPFVRVPGQNTLALVDFRPAADDLGVALATVPPSHLSAPGLASVLRFWLDEVLRSLERALVTPLPSTRAGLLEHAHLTLRDRFLRRSDGCGSTGQPDDDDWIRDCADQARVTTAGARLLQAIDALR
jgi:hypothetical protein